VANIEGVEPVLRVVSWIFAHTLNETIRQSVRGALLSMLGVEHGEMPHDDQMIGTKLDCSLKTIDREFLVSQGQEVSTATEVMVFEFLSLQMLEMNH